jgi:hypothetical protein
LSFDPGLKKAGLNSNRRYAATIKQLPESLYVVFLGKASAAPLMEQERLRTMNLLMFFGPGNQRSFDWKGDARSLD